MKNYLLILSLLFGFLVNAQTKSDSLKLIWQNDKELDSVRFKALKQYYIETKNSNPDSTILIADYHYKLAQEKKAIRQMVMALNKKAYMNISKGNYEMSLLLFDEAETLAKKLNDSKLNALIHGDKGIAYAQLENYQKAIQHYSKALKSYQIQKDKLGEGRMLNNLGGIYQIINNYELALEYYKKSLSLVDSNSNNKRNKGIAMLNIGTINMYIGNYNEAISTFESALENFQLDNNKVFESISYIELAEAHYRRNELDQAHEYAKKAHEITKARNDKTGIIHALLIIAKLTFESDVNEATSMGETILGLLNSARIDKKTKKEIYQLLYKCYKAQNKSELSLKMHELYAKYGDSIQLKENSFAVIREAIKNDFEVQLYETKLESEKEKAQLEIKQLKKTYSIIAGSAILIGCIVFYFRTNIKRNRKKRDALLEEIKTLKSNAKSNLVVDSDEFELIREQIEDSINRKLNETDWKVLNILLEEPEITNKDIAEKAYMSVDGIGSSLRRMYDYFNIKESKYKKISLLTDAIKRSNS